MIWFVFNLIVSLINFRFCSNTTNWRWLGEPILKNNVKELDPRDEAVLSFANSLLKRTLSESFVGISITDGISNEGNDYYHTSSVDNLVKYFHLCRSIWRWQRSARNEKESTDHEFPITVSRAGKTQAQISCTTGKYKTFMLNAHSAMQGSKLSIDILISRALANSFFDSCNTFKYRSSYTF